jgi:hypothetical protein
MCVIVLGSFFKPPFLDNPLDFNRCCFFRFVKKLLHCCEAPRIFACVVLRNQISLHSPPFLVGIWPTCKLMPRTSEFECKPDVAPARPLVIPSGHYAVPANANGPAVCYRSVRLRNVGQIALIVVVNLLARLWNGAHYVGSNWSHC